MQVHLETGDAPQTRRMRSFEGRAEGSSTAVEARETRGTEQSTVDHVSEIYGGDELGRSPLALDVFVRF